MKPVGFFFSTAQAHLYTQKIIYIFTFLNPENIFIFFCFFPFFCFCSYTIQLLYLSCRYCRHCDWCITGELLVLVKDEMMFLLLLCGHGFTVVEEVFNVFNDRCITNWNSVCDEKKFCTICVFWLEALLILIFELTFVADLWTLPTST